MPFSFFNSGKFDLGFKTTIPTISKRGQENTQNFNSSGFLGKIANRYYLNYSSTGVFNGANVFPYFIPIQGSDEDVDNALTNKITDILNQVKLVDKSVLFNPTAPISDM